MLAALPEPRIATGRPRRFYTCDSYNSLTLDGPVRADVIVDVTATFDTKMAALRRHVSQPIEEHVGPMAETLGRLWGARIGAGYGEAFTAVPLLGCLPGATQLYPREGRQAPTGRCGRPSRAPRPGASHGDQRRHLQRQHLLVPPPTIHRTTAAVCRDPTRCAPPTSTSTRSA
ncbi:hypothetical protein [Kitasatospora sp. NPDC050463]|uniref:PIG-L deacetylase family protein n=1 Tax=Kitasatospora sp. NPDC050463 TaxID=3155786 RepID=UPI0033E4676C